MTYFLNKLEIWFFYGFLLSFTLSIRKVLFFYPINGKFNEYAGVYFYLSDIFLILILGSWIISILYNKLLLKSRYKLNILLYLKQKVIIIPLFIAIFSFISVLWSDIWQVSLFRSMKLLEFFFLYLWAIFRLTPVIKCSTWNIVQEKCKIYLKRIIIIFIILALIQSIIGIWQFIVQKSVGLTWLKESIILEEIPGVAKIVLDGERYIRSYGLFPHPNILGGFLVISILITINYLRIVFPKERDILTKGSLWTNTNVPSQHKCSTWNILWGKRGTSVENSRKFIKYIRRRFVDMVSGQFGYYLILGFQILALILTFSKSAWIGLIISLLYFWTKNVPRGTLKGTLTRKIKYFALFGGIIILLFFILKPDRYSFLGKSVIDRIFYINVSRGTFINNPILGVGSGNFVLSLNNLKVIENWQFQPVHNVFLLILNELGIIGLLSFLWFIWEIIKNVPRGTFLDKSFQLTIRGLFFGFLLIMLLDHYFWDIQQGQIMFWLISGLLIGSKVWIKENGQAYPQVRGL